MTIGSGRVSGLSHAVLLYDRVCVAHGHCLLVRS